MDRENREKRRSQNHSFDADGQVEHLIPLWMEGGIDKRVLRDGMPKKGIEEEVMRYEDLIKEGGFVPTVDHGVPPDVSFENFKYFVDLRREVGTFS